MEFLNFGEAFRDAKRAGEKTFMYKGTRYSTETADEAKAAKNPYQDKSRVMEGVDARVREMMANPRRGALEGVYPEAALIPAARGAAGVSRIVAAALKAMRSDKTGDWRDKVPEGYDPVRWREVVKQIDEAYPSGGGVSRTPSRGMSAEERRAATMQADRTARSPRSRTREEDKTEYAKGGMAKKKKSGYAKGGMVKAMCGASMPPAQKRK